MTAVPALAELLELAWVAPLAVVVVSSSFSFLLLGATRSADHRRAGAPGLSAAYLVLAIVAGLVFCGSVAAGVGVIVAG